MKSKGICCENGVQLTTRLPGSNDVSLRKKRDWE